MLNKINKIDGITQMYLYIFIDYLPFASKNAYIIPLIPNIDKRTVYTLKAKIESLSTHF